MDADTILTELGVQAPWERRRDGLWVETPEFDARAMTRLLRSLEARWVTLTVTPVPDGGFRIIYHWDLDGELLNFAVTLPVARTDSIADLLPAAEWVERETHDYYALEFLGRDDTPALMLRPGDEAGLFSRTQELGREGDPAEYDETPPGDPDPGAATDGGAS